ncbi:hypothetical protein Nepgr_024727 [Nepenthes gracilis]|uniref:Methyltransferase n=1 Tax=Nepenthes gracilis TaxID=150966 RepID=A0AAD3T4Z4_NEPGR|nr:hypothetical protein Nepgr_024727 [Nepenthes gracilis]
MAAPPHQPSTLKPFTKPLFRILLTTILCSLLYLLGSHTSNSIRSSSVAFYTTAPITNTSSSSCVKLEWAINYTTSSPFLDFKAHHSLSVSPEHHQIRRFSFCSKNFTNYCPCHDYSRERLFTLKRFFHRERHCPGTSDEKLRCLVRPPAGYRRPFPWPKSRDMAWFSNVPFKRLTNDKKSQNWVRIEGDRLVFPGGGTSFPKGVNGYINEIKRVLPLKSGSIRTVLDVGCGVASFAAGLLGYDILTMSIAPRDIHEAQVQFALERGLPAMLGILSTYRLPYPSRSFDMAHCSRCLVQWTNYDGLYLMEIDRVLRPGGYWVLSGPPINWKANYKGWQIKADDLRKEQSNLEDLAGRLCWKKISEIGNIAVWRKPTNHIHCIKKLKAWRSLVFCKENDPDAAWYRKMEPCITPLPAVDNIKGTSGGTLKKWPSRLNTAPPRVTHAASGVITQRAFEEDNKLWRKRVLNYGGILDSLVKGKYRNIMDMNSGLGGFAASLSQYPVWVMNVVPVDAKNNTLGIIYERGLIGSYMNWCEAFSTYPRTYDLVHADGVFSMYMSKCDIVDIAFEVHRIVRPHGAVIVRDHVDTIWKVKGIMERMGWVCKLSHSEHGPYHPQKILIIDNSISSS